MFGIGQKNQTPEEVERLTYQIAQLRGQLNGVTEDLNVAREASEARALAEGYRRQVADLEIQQSKIEEENQRQTRETEETHERNMREVEHKLGLERMRQEQETKNAKRDAQLSVREENMTKRESEFKDMMTFQRTQMDAHFERFESLVNIVVGKLPNVSIGGATEAIEPETGKVETRAGRSKKDA